MLKADNNTAASIDEDVRVRMLEIACNAIVTIHSQVSAGSMLPLGELGDLESFNKAPAGETETIFAGLSGSPAISGQSMADALTAVTKNSMPVEGVDYTIGKDKKLHFVVDWKKRIVAESFKPGNTAAAVGAKYGVGNSTLSHWRKIYHP